MIVLLTGPFKVHHSYEEDIHFEVEMVEKSGNDVSMVKIRPVYVVPPNNHLPVETIIIDD